jgi:hypothetical protein
MVVSTTTPLPVVMARAAYQTIQSHSREELTGMYGDMGAEVI